MCLEKGKARYSNIKIIYKKKYVPARNRARERSRFSPRINTEKHGFFSTESNRSFQGESANGAISNSVGQRPTNPEIKKSSPVRAKADAPARELFLSANSTNSREFFFAANVEIVFLLVLPLLPVRKSSCSFVFVRGSFLKKIRSRTESGAGTQQD